MRYLGLTCCIALVALFIKIGGDPTVNAGASSELVQETDKNQQIVHPGMHNQHVRQRGHGQLSKRSPLTGEDSANINVPRGNNNMPKRSPLTGDGSANINVPKRSPLPAKPNNTSINVLPLTL